MQSASAAGPNPADQFTLGQEEQLSASHLLSDLISVLTRLQDRLKT